MAGIVGLGRGGVGWGRMVQFARYNEKTHRSRGFHCR